MSFAGFRKCIQYWGTYILNKRKEGKKPTRGKKEKKTGGFFLFYFFCHFLGFDNAGMSHVN